MARAVCTWPKFSLTSFRLVDALRRQRIAPRTVIDVGANVGQFAVAAIRLLEPAMLYSFEPLPGIVDRLQKNVAGIGVSQSCPWRLGITRAQAASHQRP
jgi:predicted RNA methylase